MIFFTVVELVNKLLGVFIIAVLSRILGVDNFVQYSAILVVFGYFLELSFFSYQKRNLVDASRNPSFIYSQDFPVRLALLSLASVTSLALFVSASPDSWGLYIWPLFFTLLLPVFTFDYFLFARKLGRFIVIARFASQLTACVLLGCFYLFMVESKYIFVIN
ncbi:MAG: hypothetical protein RPR97_04440, partial [Colwellia sp.]